MRLAIYHTRESGYFALETELVINTKNSVCIVFCGGFLTFVLKKVKIVFYPNFTDRLIPDFIYVEIYSCGRASVNKMMNQRSWKPAKVDCCLIFAGVFHGGQNSHFASTL